MICKKLLFALTVTTGSAILLTMVGAPPNAIRANAATTDCKKVKAQLASTLTFISGSGGGVTTGAVTGDHLLNGTTASNINLGGGAAFNNVNVSTYIEFLTITTLDGTLYMIVAGAASASPFALFDGPFTGLERVAGGTGKFAGATGTLFISGFAVTSGAGDTVNFTADVSGEVCIQTP